MTGSSVGGEDVERGLASLVEHLRGGPLKSLILLQGRAESFAAEPLSREDLVEELEGLVSLMLSVMVRFHEFNAELQRLVDRLVREAGEQPAAERPADEPPDRCGLN